MQAAATSQHWHDGNANDPVFARFRERVQARFAERVGDGVPLFTTDAGDLWTTYIAAFPASTRQSHNCNACHHFIRRYGGLVTIDAEGRTQPAFWDVDDAPAEYRAAISQLFLRVKRAKVTGFFLHDAQRMGADVPDHTWIHYRLEQRLENIFCEKVRSTYQAMAEKLEDRKNVALALSEISVVNLDAAVQLLKSDALYRSEKVLGQAEWLLRLALVRRDTRHAFENALWLAVATAPAGFCHPRSSMIGTLLEDIQAGLPFTVVSKRFADKMHPLKYQRPTAAPAVGNIARAEKLVETLGIAPSFERRYLRLDEVRALWTPRPAPTAAPKGGVFEHLSPKSLIDIHWRLVVPQTAITWDKFSRTVLPEARELEVCVPMRGNFAALVTAEHADAPPILQWDTEENRNPVSWYLYHGGSTPDRWGLRAGAWSKVVAVTMRPNMWNGGFEHQGKGALFVLEGAKDAQPTAGRALFPETMRSELHAIRSTIEAHSKSGTIGGREAPAHACGLMLQGSSAERPRVRVNGSVEYIIDRWD